MTIKEIEEQLKELSPEAIQDMSDEELDMRLRLNHLNCVSGLENWNKGNQEAAEILVKLGKLNKADINNEELVTKARLDYNLIALMAATRSNHR